MEIHPKEPSYSLRTDRLNVAVHNSANAPKNAMLSVAVFKYL